MWNYILYPIPIRIIEMSDKEGAEIDIVFCLPLIFMPNLENLKLLTFL